MKRANLPLILIFALITFWSVKFITATSYVAIDGQKYHFLFDDAMISMRYAWNFAHGQGLVWNPGEHVEGYTNFLWVLFMAVPSLFLDKAGAVLGVQVIGVGLLIAIAWLVDKICRESGLLSGWRKFLAVLISISYYPLLFWTMSGMETGLLTVTVLACVLFYVKFVNTGSQNNLVWLGIFTSLSYLTRNDGMIFGAILFGFVGLQFLLSKDWKGLRSAIVSGLIVVAVIGLHLLWRHSYYGELVPNTAALKVLGMPIKLAILNGLVYVKFWILGAWGVVLLSILSPKSKFKLPLLSMFLAVVAYQIYIGGDAWQYWRFFVPVTPLVFILAVHATTKLNPIISLILLGTVWWMCNQKFLGEFTFSQEPYLSEYNKLNMDYAVAIKEIGNENTRLAVFWAGEIPYYTGFYSIDFLGKMDKHIAGLDPILPEFESFDKLAYAPGHVKYDLNYSVATYNPDIIQNNRWANFILDGKYSDTFEFIEMGDLYFFLKKDAPNLNLAKLRLLKGKE